MYIYKRPLNTNKIWRSLNTNKINDRQLCKSLLKLLASLILVLIETNF